MAVLLNPKQNGRKSYILFDNFFFVVFYPVGRP